MDSWTTHFVFIANVVTKHGGTCQFSNVFRAMPLLGYVSRAGALLAPALCWKKKQATQFALPFAPLELEDTDSWIFLDTLLAFAEANELFTRSGAVVSAPCCPFLN